MELASLIFTTKINRKYLMDWDENAMTLATSSDLTSENIGTFYINDISYEGQNLVDFGFADPNSTVLQATCPCADLLALPTNISIPPFPSGQLQACDPPTYSYSFMNYAGPMNFTLELFHSVKKGANGQVVVKAANVTVSQQSLNDILEKDFGVMVQAKVQPAGRGWVGDEISDSDD